MGYKKVIGIYCIQNLINGKKYIGQSVNIKSRWAHHKRELIKGIHYNQHLQRSWTKYGLENFKFCILELCKDDELDDKEEFYIKKYKTENSKYGYNHRAGGNTTSISDATKIKIGLSNKNKIRSNVFKEHLSKVNSGRVFKHTIVYQYDLSGNFIRSFYSIAEASRQTGISYTSIRNSCHKKLKNEKFFIWSFNRDAA